MMPNTNAIMEKTNPIFFYIKCQKYCRGKAIESNREFKQLIFLTYNVCFFTLSQTISFDIGTIIGVIFLRKKGNPPRFHEYR